MKVQVIGSKKQPPRFYVNIPLPLAAALDLEAGEGHWGRVLSFGQLLLDADDLLPQGHLQGEAPTKARNRFADNCVVQTAGRLAKLS